MLKIKEFTKIYTGGKKAVDNLNLEVEAGDIYGFIGHNGAGKTTTIKAIAGVLDFKFGDIEINGISIKKKPEKCKEQMAYIPDNPDLYEHLTGIQYLNFIGDIFKIKKQEREEAIKKYSDMFEITSNLGDLISSYSHGMKQKLAIISALIHKPKLLILDEPFVGLDPKAAHILKGIMKELCQEGGAIFFSTHVLEVAEKLCNKIAIIKGGKLIASGETEKIIGNNTLEDVFMELIDNE
ncbi:MAG: ABC transporter ATP-binding protein [Clostridium sp.]|nr:ABC transporter ATP-binding protein [Clostridium sp.]